MYATPNNRPLEAGAVPAMPETAIVTEPDGTVLWNHLPGDQYLVEGCNERGERLPQILARVWQVALAIPLSSGRRFLLRAGRRYLLQEV